jgi:hypothetical protein
MGGRRRVSKTSRARGIGRIAYGGAQSFVGFAGLSVGHIGGLIFSGAGARNVVKGGRQVFARTGRGSGSGGRQKGHPFYGNQYVKVSSRNRARKR